MSYTNLIYHIVFATRDRRPWLHEEFGPRLVRYIGGIVRERDGSLAACNGPEDHIHIALVASPSLAVSDLLRHIKGSSSKWVHEEFPELKEFAWQDGYAAFSVSRSALGRVVKYIENQREHHRKLTFQEELTALLERHGIEYDARYLV